MTGTGVCSCCILFLHTALITLTEGAILPSSLCSRCLLEGRNEVFPCHENHCQGNWSEQQGCWTAMLYEEDDGSFVMHAHSV